MHKIETVKVPQGNAFQLLLPFKTARWENAELVPDNIDTRFLEDVVITIDGIVWENYEMDDRGPIVAIPEDMALGAHNAEITATYAGVPIRGAFYECFTIVEWSFESNVEQHLPDSPLVAETSYVYIGITDDQELEALKQQLRNAIAENEAARLAYIAAKDEFDEKAEALDDIAQETTSQQILEKLDNIDFSEIVSNINDIKTLVGEATDPATAETIFGRLQEVLNAISNIDFSALAKQGSNPNATNSAILEAIGQIAIDDPYSQALATFFNITPPVPDAVPMTQQEVEDDLDELWNLIITQ